MSYDVRVIPPAQKEIEALPGYVRAQARQLIRGLKEDPRPPRAKELRNKPSVFRIWLAKQWRIVYRIEEDPRQVLILRVRRKEQIDYESL